MAFHLQVCCNFAAGKDEALRLTGTAHYSSTTKTKRRDLTLPLVTLCGQEEKGFRNTAPSFLPRAILVEDSGNQIWGLWFRDTRVDSEDAETDFCQVEYPHR